MGDGSSPDRNDVLLVPPPVRRRRLRVGPHADIRPATQAWIETDAESPDGAQVREERDLRRRQAPYPAGIPVPDSLEESARSAAAEAYDIHDPLSISHSNTVPLFGLAPERAADPLKAAPPEPIEAEPPPRWPWIVAGIILATATLLAAALILL